jgi:hypothetical protein
LPTPGRVAHDTHEFCGLLAKLIRLLRQHFLRRRGASVRFDTNRDRVRHRAGAASVLVSHHAPPFMSCRVISSRAFAARLVRHELDELFLEVSAQRRRR